MYGAVRPYVHRHGGRTSGKRPGNDKRNEKKTISNDVQSIPESFVKQDHQDEPRRRRYADSWTS